MSENHSFNDEITLFMLHNIHISTFIILWEPEGKNMALFLKTLAVLTSYNIHITMFSKYG